MSVGEAEADVLPGQPVLVVNGANGAMPADVELAAIIPKGFVLKPLGGVTDGAEEPVVAKIQLGVLVRLVGQTPLRVLVGVLGLVGLQVSFGLHLTAGTGARARAACLTLPGAAVVKTRGSPAVCEAYKS